MNLLKIYHYIRMHSQRNKNTY